MHHRKLLFAILVGLVMIIGFQSTIDLSAAVLPGVPIVLQSAIAALINLVLSILVVVVLRYFLYFTLWLFETPDGQSWGLLTVMLLASQCKPLGNAIAKSIEEEKKRSRERRNKQQ